MGRVSLSWSRAELAEAAGIGVATVVRFEGGKTVSPDSISAMRRALEAKRVKFVEDGPFKGAVHGGVQKAP